MKITDFKIGDRVTGRIWDGDKFIGKVTIINHKYLYIAFPDHPMWVCKEVDGVVMSASGCINDETLPLELLPPLKKRKRSKITHSNTHVRQPS